MRTLTVLGSILSYTYLAMKIRHRYENDNSKWILWNRTQLVSRMAACGGRGGVRITSFGIRSALYMKKGTMYALSLSFVAPNCSTMLLGLGSGR